MSTKNVFFVYCDISYFKETFKKSKSSEVLIESEVKRKLQNRDVLKEEPTDNIVRYHISKKISSFISSKRSEFLYYHIEDMTEDIVNRIKNFKNGDVAKRHDVSIWVMADSKKRYEDIKDEFDMLIIKETI